MYMIYVVPIIVCMQVVTKKEPPISLLARNEIVTWKKNETMP